MTAACVVVMCSILDPSRLVKRQNAVDGNFFMDNMSKRAQHSQVFYASLFDLRDSSFTSKYRPMAKPSVMGVFEVECIVAKRIKGGQEEYFIQWKNYSPIENTWELLVHLPEELICCLQKQIS